MIFLVGQIDCVVAMASGESSLPLIEGEKVEVPTKLLARARSAFLYLLRALSSSRPRNETKQLRKTAYLDGLRGFSALLVYLQHHVIWSHPAFKGHFILENAFGWHGNYYFATLPVIRIFFTGGNSAVAIFYLISGYVLSVTALNAIHSLEPARLADYLGSALFRRWARLFLPVLATTFVWMTSWHLLGIKSNNSIAKKPAATYTVELWEFYRSFKSYSFIFSEFFWNEYNDHLWSIPLEFRGSVFVWITLLSFARSPPHIRLCLDVGLIFYLTCIVDGWYCACFMVGLLLCELDMLAEKTRLPGLFSRLKTRSWMYWVMMLIAMYLAGVTSIQHYADPKADLEELRTTSPGWYYLSFLVPGAFSDYRWFYRIISGTLIMIAVPRIPLLKRFFESRFCQYLGKVSYALYLVHGPVLWSLGDRIYAAVGRTEERHLTDIPKWMDLFPLPGWGPLGLEVNYLIPQLILLPLTLWIASIVTKTVDDPSVKLAKRIFDFCTASSARA
jgi:peptidoglycan/LPS O-acetylase OafA/YrhL